MNITQPKWTKACWPYQTSIKQIDITMSSTRLLTWIGSWIKKAFSWLKGAITQSTLHSKSLNRLGFLKSGKIWTSLSLTCALLVNNRTKNNNFKESTFWNNKTPTWWKNSVITTDSKSLNLSAMRGRKNFMKMWWSQSSWGWRGKIL